MEYKLKQVEGYQNYYIDTLGGVFLLKEYISGKKLMYAIKKSVLDNGYYTVSLRDTQGNQNKTLVHRLVAINFIYTHDRTQEVNHKDGNKTNNSVDNLEWCDRKHNIRHAVLNSLTRRSKYSEETKTLALQDFKDGISMEYIAGKYKLNVRAIIQILGLYSHDGNFDKYVIRKYLKLKYAKLTTAQISERLGVSQYIVRKIKKSISK